MSESNPSLPLVWSAFTGYQHTAAVRAAVELDVFTAIGEGATTLDRLAKRCGAAERGLRALCNHLVMDGFLARNGDTFALTPTSEAFLDRRSSGYVGSAVLFITEPTIVDGFTRLTEAVRRGGTAIPQSGTLAPEHPIWVEFARSMAPLASLTGVLLANVLDASKGGPCKVLDIAAGHGMFGISIARENPKAQVVGLDWKNVLEVARANAAAAGLGERYR